MSLGPLKISRNLTIGFAVVFLISFLVAAGTWYKVRQVEYYNDHILRGYEAIGGVRNVQLVLASMEGSRRGYRITGEAKYLSLFRLHRTWVMRQVANMEENLRASSTPAGLAEDSRIALSELIGFWDTLNLQVTNWPDAEKRTITGQERKQVGRVMGLLSQAASAEEAALNLNKAEAHKVRQQIAWQLGIGILLIEGIILALVLVIRQEFRRRRKADKNMKRQLSAVQRLNDVRDEKNWLLQGLTVVRDSIQESAGLDDLARHSLMSVIQYTGSAAGALYLVSHADGSLTRQAAVGFPHDHPAFFHAGEGLPGLTAATAKTIRTGPLEDASFSLISATAASPYGEVLLVPFCHNKEVVAVMELAAFKAFAPNVVTLLEEVGTSIAIAINAARAGLRADELLKEVQSKKEALEEQQEELRRTNEALTVQTEELQISQEELRTQEQELRQMNETLERQNDRLEATGEALVQQAAALERSNRYKSDFLANVSHELRTPLNSILILARLLEEQATGSGSKQQEYSSIIHKSGTDLLALINDILDLSKIEAGKLDVEPATVMIEDVSQQMRDLFEVQAREKDITLEVRCLEHCPEQITTDPQRLAQILKNLLSNAIKFTDRGGQVALEFRRLDGKGARPAIAILVSDSGIGIPLAKQHQIFEAFQQADSAINRRYGGTGLGLSISRELSRLLGGSLTVKSEEGKGSVFTLMLPQHAPTTGPTASTPSTPPPHETPAQRAVPDDREALTPDHHRVLISEDDPSFAAALRDVAREEGFQTIVALNGEEAMRCVHQYRPDAIILDMHLPGKDGWQILRQLEQDAQTRHIPVHVISSATQQIPVGPVAVLRKPASRESLRLIYASLADLLRTRSGEGHPAGDPPPPAPPARPTTTAAPGEGSVPYSTLLQNRVALIVDDDMRNIFALSLLLQSQGMEVLTANNGREALDMLAEHPETEIVLLDVMMPEMDGCEALRRIREQPALAVLPVVMLSAGGLAEEEKSRALGANDFIRKPVDNDRLLGLVVESLTP